MTANKVLVTGADGFIGKALCRYLKSISLQVVKAVRSPTDSSTKVQNDDTFVLGDFCANTDWENALQGVDHIVHLAGRAHVLNETNTSPLAAYRKTNTEATTSLALEAARQGVKRFVFVSSIGVCGNRTLVGSSYSEDDKPNPHNDYALSKLEAEDSLLDIASQTGMEVVIIRPTLVYGPEVKANFLRLIQLVDKRLPLPFASLQNIRSFLALENLVDFIAICLDHPSASNEIFNIADGQDISTLDLVRKIGVGLGKTPFVFPVPVPLLRLLCRVIGRENDFTGIAESLQVDISKAKMKLGWEPLTTLDSALANTVRWYVEQK